MQLGGYDDGGSGGQLPTFVPPLSDHRTSRGGPTTFIAWAANWRSASSAVGGFVILLLCMKNASSEPAG